MCDGSERRGSIVIILVEFVVSEEGGDGDGSFVGKTIIS